MSHRFRLLMTLLVVGGSGQVLGHPAMAAPGGTPPPVRTLPAAPRVADPGLALLLGIVEYDARGTFSAREMQRQLNRAGRTTRFPLENLGSVIRTPPLHRGTAEMVLVFRGPAAMPIPYRILAYRPGTLRSTALVRLTEWRLGDLPIRLADGSHRRFTDVRVWGIHEGAIEIDIDGWVDRLLGPRLDDTKLAGIALVRENGRQVALALGYNRGGRGLTGAFDPGTDAILFPTDEAHRRAGQALRERLEGLMPEVRRIRNRR